VVLFSSNSRISRPKDPGIMFLAAGTGCEWSGTRKIRIQDYLGDKAQTPRFKEELRITSSALKDIKCVPRM
jgi:hypothetical protein